MVQIQISQCPSNREFPEVFKTHPAYICRYILKAYRSLQTKQDMLSDRTCITCLHADSRISLKDSISYTVSPLYKLFLNVYDWSNIKIGKYNSNGKKVGDKLKVFTGLNCESQEGMKI